ncbi:two-component sensor histidine kinase [Halovibrio salipaludis]|uniref:histidine kinase n=1 Tax=Halovibrio salipaludis TaxID=2032626 RepID=A0A2A2F2L0_9GAMM|nr:histidine kinase dimerization/phospho-acceptor domain-containing protein [Halovibrio salipaludis]PAU79851.1 two-component sensor histidine kinase [Halovibrio salipaludis]
MTLKRRLVLGVGLALGVLWASAAALLFLDLRSQVSDTLDERLAASARMVAGLVARQPGLLESPRSDTELVQPESEGVACQIQAAGGEVLVRTEGANSQALDAREPGYRNTMINGERWRLYTLEHNGLHITTADRMTERGELREGILLVLVAPFALALAGGIGVVWFGISRGLAPLERLSREVSRRRPSMLTPVDIGSAPAELQPVVSTLNDLLARVNEAIQREQHFASQAAHELRTPLTAIKTNLQVAARQAPEASRALDQAQAGIQRMQRIIEQLLMLARVERAGAHGHERAAVETVIHQAIADLPERDRIRTDSEPSLPDLPLPAPLASTALRNLLENALRHGTNGETVELRVKCSGTDLVMTVTNPAGENATGDPERSDGLGLTIVRAITERFDARFEFRHPREGMVEAVITWPT